MTKTIKNVSLAVAILLSPIAVSAQTETTANDSVAAAQTTETAPASHILFGYLSYSEALKQMPLYADAQKSLEQLKATYKQELERSEQEFSKLFEEYVDGQKSFPENILLKRQKELQQLLEQTLAFKDETQRLLTNAEAELMLPVNKQLNETIANVARRKGFAFVINTDANNCPYVNGNMGENITAEVIGSVGK